MTGIVSESTADGLKVRVGNRVLEVQIDEEIWLRGTLARTRCTEDLQEQNHLHISTCAYEALRSWRLNRARLDGVSAFMVAHNTTLQAIADEQPNTLNDLLGIKGIGPVKLERYGSEILGVLGAATDCCRGISSSERSSTS
jgi:ribonuclease D